MSRQFSDATQQLISQFFDAEDAAVAQDAVVGASTQAATEAINQRDQDVAKGTDLHNAAHDLGAQVIAAVTQEISSADGLAPAAAGLMQRIKDRRAKRHGG